MVYVTSAPTNRHLDNFQSSLITSIAAVNILVLPVTSTQASRSVGRLPRNGTAVSKSTHFFHFDKKNLIGVFLKSSACTGFYKL